jgi:O-antigen/teichoic acid export membrane protein
MTALAMPVSRARGYLRLARSDSMVRNSLYLMASTVVTGALGYVFWIVTAHIFTSAQVGIGSAVISLCSTVALLTYMGPGMTLIERLHAYERSSRWTAVLVRTCGYTAAFTAVATLVAVPVLARSRDYHSFFDAVSPVVVAVVGATAWTLVNMISDAFISARRADRLLSLQTAVSAAKVVIVIPVAVTGAGAAGIVGAWVASAILGVAFGALWLVPRLGLGRRPADAEPAAEPRRLPRERRAGAALARLLGQHVTSVGEAVTPLVLPILVVLRLGVTPNGYFYITWMIGSVFFMVSPSVAQALFAEGVRADADLRRVVGKAFRVIGLLVVPAIVVMVAAGRPILGIFGASYASAGYGLLILLALSAIPDAVSNIAVASCRVNGRLGYSSGLNIGILVTTVAAAWLLMPVFGIAGVGVAWLGAQTLSALFSIPVYARLGRRVIA